MTTKPTVSDLDATTATEPAVEIPWYDLLDDPEPPEDGMQQEPSLYDVMFTLYNRYRDDPTVLVTGPLTNLIYDSDVPGSFIVPDIFIVFDLDDEQAVRRFRSYRIQQWGPIPSLVLEIASASTAPRDLYEKREIYARIGAQEYWRLDRSLEYYGEPLVGERLVDGDYQRFRLHTEENGDVWASSEVLGLDFYFVSNSEETRDRFKLRVTATGEWLDASGLDAEAKRLAVEGRIQAEERMRQEAEARAARAEARVEEAEARNRALQAEIDRLRQQ